jgi:hypothetical protein
VELSSVSFTTDQLGDATSQALTGTWTLYYYDELPGLPAMPQCDQAMWWQGNTAYVHSVTIGGTVYSVAEGTLSSNAIAVAIANQINAADPNCTAVVGGASSNEIVVSLRPGVAAAVTVSSSDGSAAATLTPLAMASGDTTLTLSAAGPGQVAQRIQLDQEVMLITAVSSDQKTYTVTRGMDGTTAAAHAGAAVYYLQSKSGTLAFPAGYFAASYVAGWTPVEGIIPLPDVRIASATLAMTNANGTGPAAAIALTHNTSDGIRTLAGGFINFQIWGFLAVDAVATPAVNVGAANSVRDVFATVGTSADAAVKLTINRNGAGWAWLTFASGTIVSNSVDGTTLAPLVDGDQLTLSITAVGSVYPGADLTVLIRL